METLIFTDISALNRGDIFNMLIDSYNDLYLKYDIHNKQKYIDAWKKSDEMTFNHKDSIGKCVIVSQVDGENVGFISYDPRNLPSFGVVGQNCILTKYKGHGYGRQQLNQLIKIFKERDCELVKVSTGDSEFFVPAQKMYVNAGFKEVNRIKNAEYGFDEIFYELHL